MDFCVLNTPFINGLVLVSGIGGLFGSYAFFIIFSWCTGIKADLPFNRESFYSGVVTGIAERFFFTTLIGLMGYGGIAAAIIAWVGIKGQLHYKIFTDTDEKNLPRAYLGILGSLASMTFAVVGGYVWHESVTL